MSQGLSLQEYRRFLFTSTGEHTDDRKLSEIDVYDNLIGELDRLDAIGELMTLVNDEVSEDRMRAVGELLKDIHARMRTILEVWDTKPAKRRRK